MNLQNLVDFCEEYGLPGIFDGVSVPVPLNPDVVKSAIMVRCGLMTPLYGEPDTFRNLVTHWFTTKQWTFEHLIAVIQSEYSPIENVYENRKETTTFGSSNIHSGGYSDTASGKDTTTHSEHDYTERTYDNYHDATERSFDNYHDATERSFDNYHDATERSFDNYHDATERTHTNFKDDVDHTYTNYKETTKYQGSHVTESLISAFNDSAYQADKKTGETYGENVSGTADPRQDEKSTSGSHKDSRSITGSYKDDRTETGTYKDDRTETGTYKDDRTETGSYKDDTVYGHKITLDNGKKITRTYSNDKEDHVGIDTFEVFRHGNIGVTTNQQMINEELELLRHFDIYSFIAELFENDNMLMIY